MKKQLTLLHRWIGVPLGLIFVITFATGGLTALDELIERAKYQSMDYVAEPASTREEQLLSIETLLAEHSSIRSLYLPTEQVPFYRLSSRQESWRYSSDGQVLLHHEKRSQGNDFFRTMLQLHRNLLLGKEGIWGIGGNDIVAWVSLVALLISLIGLWLWWPRRRTFKAKDIVPQGKERKHFYISHMSAGVISLVSILLLALTGASITYRDVTKQLFNANSSEMAMSLNESAGNNFASWHAAAYNQMPSEAKLIRVRFTKQRNKGNKKAKSKPANLMQFRFATNDDWFGLARSTVTINRDNSQLVSVSTFGQLTWSQKVYSVLIALHTGFDLPWYYTFILLLFSILGTIMTFSGVWSFVMKHWKKKRSRRFSLGKARLS